MSAATPLATALRYAELGWHLFPCRRGDKRPITAHGFHDASNNPLRIAAWWMTDPDALIGFWPGGSDIAVLDIDRKNGVDGLVTLGELDTPILPVTPTVITRSGGLHLHFQMPDPPITITVGDKGRGIGVGLDWRGSGGYVILPSPGSGYRWGQWHYGNCRPVSVPPPLMPREPRPRPMASEPSALPGRASLDGVLRRVRSAANGERNALLYWGACRFSEAVAKGLLFEADARAHLLQAAAHAGLDEREAEATINSGFREGTHA